MCVLHSMGKNLTLVSCIGGIRLAFSRVEYLRQHCLATWNPQTSPLSQKLWFHLLGPRLSSDRFSRPDGRHLRACQIWLELPCRVAWSISLSNGSLPFFSRSQGSRPELCQAPQFHRAVCSYLHDVFVWHSEESALPSLRPDSETLLQQNPSAAWLNRAEDERAETSPVGTSTGMD